MGQKRSLKPKHVWAIRVRLELAENHRDLAPFNMAIDSKLRGCDLVRMQVVDIMASGQVKERASVLQSKTQKPVRFEISEGTRTSVEKWMEDELMVGSEYLWPERFHERLHISTRQYARIVRDWVTSIGLDAGNGTVFVEPIESFSRDVGGRVSPASKGHLREAEVLMIDFLSPISATVKIRIRAHQSVFVDHLGFVSGTNGWRIVSKIWHLESTIDAA